MKTFSEADIRKMFKQQNYKYASLLNSDGKSVVTYNTESNPKIKAIDKVNEAFERLKILPDGLYTFQFANSKGRNLAPDQFAYLKGNLALDETGKGHPFHIIQQAAQTPSKNDYDKVLSYPEVIALQLELTTVKFNLQSVNKELDKANATIAALEKEVAELEAKGLGEDTSPAKWFENVLPHLMPVADRYFGIQERKLDLQEKGMQRPKPQPKPQQKKRRPLPEIGSPEFEKMLDDLEAMSDEDYQRCMHRIKQSSPDHYNAIVAQLEGEEEENENENT